MLSGNPQDMAAQLLSTNPQFAEFMRNNQGKTPEQVAQENGIDFNVVKRFLR